MNDGTNAKQVIVEKIRQSTNILVAVSANPSLDSLAAALALTIMLNKLDKHGTAVFSGELPQAMQFLEPGKTFESNVDSLRDFIISLDKEKADRLRYKVEDSVVRIFITPYRTTITQNDLQFSQGDFNVELIIALGVEKREDLDKAIVAHGRILHDAAAVTINAGNQQSSLGAVDWRDTNASSLCEMLLSLSESLQKPGILDGQVANALLTGIVAATNRFSNEHTTPRVMTMAAQLMAAGANQQLVATNVQGILPLPEANKPLKQDNQAPTGKDGQLSIDHAANKPDKKFEQPEQKSGESQAEKELEKSLPQAAIAPTIEELREAFEQVTPKEPVKKTREFISDNTGKTPGGTAVGTFDDVAQHADAAAEAMGGPSWRGRKLQPPTLGGSLSATAQDALDDKNRSEQEDRNNTILNHDANTRPDAIKPPKNVMPTKESRRPQQPPALPPLEPPIAVAEPLSEPPAPLSPPAIQAAPPATAPEPPVAALPPPLPTIESTPPAVTPSAKPAPLTAVTPPAEPELPADLDAARAAVDAALAAQPFNPAGKPLQSVGAQPMTEAPGELSAPPPAAQQPTALSAMASPAPTPEPPAVGINALPPLPPMPPLEHTDPGGLPPMPPSLPPTPLVPPIISTPSSPAPPVRNDPSQFKIPGQ